MTAPVNGDLAPLAEFACDLASLAASVTRPYFRQPLDVISKADSSPVTIADQECERLIRETIAKRYPDHGILGEEHGFDGSDKSDVWVIDPIDGTKSFVSGLPLYGTLIAYTQMKDAIIGVLSMPELDEFWIGIKGEGCFFNGSRCRTSDCTGMAEIAISTPWWPPALQILLSRLDSKAMITWPSFR